MRQGKKEAGISKEEVKHVADLARFDMDDESIRVFSDQIGKILQYVNTLQAVNTENVTPTFHAIFLTNAFREDEVTKHLGSDSAISNAPESEDTVFLVPKVIG
jgi:aspartyl-tRNA(Asn)/glutamyl-tRNA(Gln) amidotransferase subunit C